MLEEEHTRSTAAIQRAVEHAQEYVKAKMEDLAKVRSATLYQLYLYPFFIIIAYTFSHFMFVNVVYKMSTLPYCTLHAVCIYIHVCLCYTYVIYIM